MFLGPLKFEYIFMKSVSQYTATTYDPGIYGFRISRAVTFYKQMLIRRQKVLLLSSIEQKLRLVWPIFTYFFNIYL